MRLFLLFLFTPIVQLTWAQNPTIEELNALMRGHPKEDTIKVALLNELSVRILKSQPEKSFDYAQQAHTLAERLKFQKGIGEAKNNLAVYHLLRGNAEVSIDLALEAVKIGEREHCRELLASSYAILGTVYHSQLAYDKARHYLLLSQDLNSNTNNPLIASKVFNALGGIVRDKGIYDSALFYYDKALAVMKASGDYYRLPEVLNNIGIVHMRQQKTDIALTYYYKSLQASEKDNNIRAQALVLGNIGQVFLSVKDYKEAEKVLLKSLSLSKNIGDRKILSAAYMTLGQLKNETGKFEEAHAYLSSFYELKDSLVNVEKVKKIAELEIRFETEKKGTDYSAVAEGQEYSND